MNTPSLIFRQLFEASSCTYTYILGCPSSREAVIIDPVLETVDRDAKLVNELNLKLKFGLNTHVHADHITGTGRLAKEFASMRTGLSDAAGAKADFFLAHGDTLRIGKLSLQCRHTPGHTHGCASFVLPTEKMVFTGDALFFRGCGRTDFQQGDAGTLYDNVWKHILSLPEEFLIFPGHNYEGHMVTTVAEEKKLNPRLTLSRDKFVNLMNNLKLPHPKQIDRAVPVNLLNGEI